MNGLRAELDRAIPAHGLGGPNLVGLLREGRRARLKRRLAGASVGIVGLGVAGIAVVTATTGPRDVGHASGAAVSAATQTQLQEQALYDMCAADADPRLILKGDPAAQAVVLVGFDGDRWKETPGIDLIEGPDFVAFQAGCGDQTIWKFDFAEDSGRREGGWFTPALPGMTFRTWVATKTGASMCEGPCGP